MWKLTENGDLSFSDNAVLQTITGITQTTYQSAAVLIGTVKGSYPFIPSLGLDIDTIMEARVVQGVNTITNVEYLTELLIRSELEKEPNITLVSNFTFVYDSETRGISVTFEISIVSGITLGIGIGI